MENHQSSPATDADRIALNNMFRAIAEYGRKVRLRRLAECPEPPCESTQEDQPALELEGEQAI
jgi:hypothetical protein